MQFMETFQARFKANQNLIQNLEIQVGKLVKAVVEIPFLVTREKNLVEVEAHEESLVKKQDSGEKEKNEERTQQQWEKCLQVEIQQESLLQVKISNPFYFFCFKYTILDNA